MEVLARARAVRRLRTAVLVVLVVVVVGGAGLWWLGRSVGPGSRSEREPSGTPERSLPQGTFEFTASEGDRPLFRVRASGSGPGADGLTDLERVELTLFGEDGRELAVAADRASYDPEKREGTLVGNVVVTSQDGMRLESDELALAQGGKLLTSESPVQFWMGEKTPLQGRADRLRFDFRREIFGIAGDVEVWALNDPRQFRLSAGRILFENAPQRLIRAEIGVRLSERDGELFARRMAIYFTADGRNVEFVRGRWDVQAKWKLAAGADGVPRALRAKALGFSLVLDPVLGQPRKLELEGSWLERARIGVEDPQGGTSQATARYLQGDFAEGRLVEVLALGLVEIAEVPLGAQVPDRLACGGRATASFTADGQIARLELDEDVDLHQAGFQASGEHAESLLSTGESTLTGSPALLLTSRGELRAPQVKLRRGSELLEATGGVDARLPRDGVAWMGGEAGSAAPWIQVRAERAQMVQGAESWSFEEGVRAWSGSDVLTADQLRGDSGGRSLVASGSVETVARMVRQDGTSSPLRVQANTLEYAPERDMALYRGDVVAREEGRRISSDELEIGLDDKGQAREVLIRGSVRLTDPTGRTVAADRGRYDPAAGQIRFEGEPVVVEDGKGGRVAGRVVDYTVESGQVRVSTGLPVAPEVPSASEVPGP